MAFTRYRPQRRAALVRAAAAFVRDALLFLKGSPGTNIGSTRAAAAATTPVNTVEGVQVNSFNNGWTFPGYSAVPITVILDFRTLGSPAVGNHALWTSQSSLTTATLDSGLYFRYSGSALQILKSQIALIGSASYTIPSRGGVVAFTFDGTNYKIAADGVVLASSSNAQTCNFGKPVIGVEGVSSIQGGDVANAVFRSVQVLPRVATDAELVSLTKNPYQNFALEENDTNDDLLFVPTGGTAIDLLIASCMSKNTSAAAAMSQVHAPTVQNATQGTASASLATSQTHTLTATAGAQANASAALVVGQAHALNAAPATNYAACAPVAVGQVHGLQPAAATSYAASTAYTLSQTHALTASTSTQLTSSVAFQLSAVASYTLGIGSAAQANVSAAMAAAQEHALAPTVVTQAATSQPVQIGTSHTLFGLGGTSSPAIAPVQVGSSHTLVATASLQQNVSPRFQLFNIPLVFDPNALYRVPAKQKYYKAQAVQVLFKAQSVQVYYTPE